MQTNHTKEKPNRQENNTQFSSKKLALSEAEMANPNLRAALELAGADYSIFPAKANKAPYVTGWQKKATTDAKTIRQWWSKWPDAIPALPTGERNRVAVLDVDKKKGKDGEAALVELGYDLKQMSHIRVRTLSGGWHLYFDWPEGLGSSAEGWPSGIDVRGQGGFVIAPNSIITPEAAKKLNIIEKAKKKPQFATSGTYKSGGITLIDDPIGLSPWPKTLLPTKPTPTDSPKEGTIPFDTLKDALLHVPNDGSDLDKEDRHWWLGMLAALHFETSASAEGLELVHKWSNRWPGANPDKTDAAWRSFKRRDGSLKTGASIVFEARKHGWQDPKEKERMLGLLDDQDQTFELDEDGVIQTFTLEHKDDLRFDHDLNRWFKYDGNCWRNEGTKLAHHFAREISTTMAAADPKAKALRKVNVWEAIERGARTVREFVATSKDWNQDQYLLGTPGGTVDLKTGVLRPGKPDDLISKLAAVAPIPLDKFEPERDCPKWLAFLNEALGDDADAIRFLQMWGGYSLTGDIKEQSLVFVYGPGGSGKSTAINTIANVLSEYTTNMPASVLTRKKYESHPEEIARLDGARFVWASETEKGALWNETRIKSFSGGDMLTGRYMRTNTFEFMPQFKMTIVGNNHPTLQNPDEAMMRRFNILPFDNIPDKKDPDLPEKLKKEWPGILSWLIQGCLDWQKNGLIRPEATRVATDSYFEEQDTFAKWIDGECEIGERLADTTSNLWDSWLAYALRNGEDPGSRKRTFPETLSQKGFLRTKDSHGIRGRGYLGLAVIEKDATSELDEIL